MPKLKGVAVVALSFVLALLSLGRTQAREPQFFLIFVDDLHLDFRSTPRLRELIKKTTLLLTQEGDAIALVNSGAFPVAIGPTSNHRRIIAGMSRITGDALRADHSVDPEQAPERIRRATTAITTARNAIRAVAAKAKGPFAVLYFSGGYAEQSVAAELFELVSDAFHASVVIYTVAPPLVGSPMPPPSVGNESAWEAYDRNARDSLRNLAESTGGRVISAPGELDGALAQIARTRD